MKENIVSTATTTAQSRSSEFILVIDDSPIDLASKPQHGQHYMNPSEASRYQLNTSASQHTRRLPYFRRSRGYDTLDDGEAPA